MQVPLIPIILNPDSVVAYNSDNLSMHEHYVLKTISDESKTISDESKTVGIYIYIYIYIPLSPLVALHYYSIVKFHWGLWLYCLCLNSFPIMSDILIRQVFTS